MRLARTTFALDEITQHLAGRAKDALIESYFVQYLLVAFYSEVEEHVKKIIERRIAQINDRKVAAFVFATNEGMLRRVKKAELNDVLKKFACGDGDVLSSLCGDTNLQPYHDAVNNRHDVSHNAGTNMTLDEFRKSLVVGEVVLKALEEALSAD